MNLFRLVLCLIALALYAIVKQLTANSSSPGGPDSSATVQTTTSAVGVIPRAPTTVSLRQANASTIRVFSLEADLVGEESPEPNRSSN